MKRNIKLRDLTAEQWDDYISKCLGRSCSDCIFEPVNCRGSENKKSWFNNKDLYSDKFLDQEVEIEVPDILTKEEKEYLSNVIKPFRNEIAFITKEEGLYYNTEYINIIINIIIENRETTQFITLPSFLKNSAYKKMEIHKLYSLDKLGL